MLRIGVVLLTIGFFAQSWARSLEHGNLIERLKRSPYYCDPEPPPPILHWPPPPPPYWQNYHHGPDHSFDRPPSSFPGPGPSFPEPGPSFPGPGHSFSGSESLFNGFELSWTQGQRLTDSQNDPSNEPCKSCKGKNAVVSNSENVNGDSISIAISRSK